MTAKDEAANEQNITTEGEEQGTKAAEKPVKAGPKARRAAEEAKEQPAKGSKLTTARSAPSAKTKPRAQRRGQKYRASYKLIDRNQLYSLEEAVKLAQKTSTARFDATIELHLRLAVDPRQADQNVRGTVVLPHGTGKQVRIAVFAPAGETAEAKQAGAEIAGEEEILTALKKGQVEFDILIAHPQSMAKLGQFAKLLGPRGLMPNPKSGTVTANLARAVNEAKAGRVEFRIDKQALLHIPVGKVSFKAAALTENTQSVYSSVRSARPASVKGTYIERGYLTTTMGPSIPLDLATL